MASQMSDSYQVFMVISGLFPTCQGTSLPVGSIDEGNEASNPRLFQQYEIYEDEVRDTVRLLGSQQVSAPCFN